jgi:hypothetical protein
MLCQLVCVDRRYQRMNCFNIREIQGILKRKFFTDLVNNSDNRMGIDNSVLNMRYKNNMSNILLYDQSLFYNFDLTNSSKSKLFPFNSLKSTEYTPFQIFNNQHNLNLGISQYIHYNSFLKVPFLFLQILKDLSYFFSPYIILSSISLVNMLSYLKIFFSSVFFIPHFNFLSMYNHLLAFLDLKPTRTTQLNNNFNAYTTSPISYNNNSLFNFSDNSTS